MHDYWIGTAAELCGGVTFIGQPLIGYRRHGGNVTELSHGSLWFMLKKRMNILRCLFVLKKRAARRRKTEEYKVKVNSGRHFYKCRCLSKSEVYIMEIKKRYLLPLSFFIPLAVMIVCMAIFRVGPFGSNSFLIIDGLHQYMPFFSVLYDKLKEGGSLFYSFRTGLGVNFLSLFSYYLSSPLNLLIVFFDKTQLNMAVSLLLVLKVALSGLTAGVYFSSRTKKTGNHRPALFHGIRSEQLCGGIQLECDVDGCGHDFSAGRSGYRAAD